MTLQTPRRGNCGIAIIIVLLFLILLALVL